MSSLAAPAYLPKRGPAQPCVPTRAIKCLMAKNRSLSTGPMKVQPPELWVDDADAPSDAIRQRAKPPVIKQGAQKNGRCPDCKIRQVATQIFAEAA
jgi:hypothetical protein